METYPSGLTIKPVASYYDETSGVTITVSKRSGGIGADDYLIAGTNGFTATHKTEHQATKVARRELAQLAKAKQDA